MNKVAIIQARTNSRRLPGKSLLTVSGLPLVVLAAKRAANTGQKVIVATSCEPSDDALATTVREHGFECFRGSLDDPLSRINDALKDYDDATAVFRMTADNVLPDGRLLDEIEDEFRSKKLDYLCCGGKQSGLPYGISVEITWLKHLREANRLSSDTDDREHVTPFIVRKFGRRQFEKYASLRLGHYRCTIDNLSDFILVSKIFSDVEDPIYTEFLSFLPKLIGQPLQPTVAAPVTKLTLGTAQLGMPYGILNGSGKPADESSIQIIRAAITNGVESIDTARAYGDSEKLIGRALEGGWDGRARVISKLGPIAGCPADANPATVEAFVDASIFQSLSALQTRKIDVLMLHRVAHLQNWGGAVWHRLCALRNEGHIGALGASVQSPEELAKVLANGDVHHIQLPLNILDWRWGRLRSQVLEAQSLRGVELQVRSVFLQGLLLSSLPKHWARAHVSTPKLISNWLETLVHDFNRSSIADLALGYVAGLPWVDGIVFGVETMDQLLHNLHLSGSPPLTEEQIARIDETRPFLDECSLDPSRWDPI